MIVAEKRVEKKENNPQSLFSRWNIPGFRGRTAEDHRSIKESFGKKFAMSKKKRASNKRAQDHENENSQKRLNMFYTPPAIPTFDPNQVVTVHFSWFTKATVLINNDKVWVGYNLRPSVHQ